MNRYCDINGADDQTGFRSFVIPYTKPARAVTLFEASSNRALYYPIDFCMFHLLSSHLLVMIRNQTVRLLENFQ